MIPLIPSHRQQLYQSGLTDETIAAAEIVSCTDPSEAAQVLNWNSDNGPAPSIAFPQFIVGAQRNGYTLRSDTARRRRDGREPKYEVPAGSTPRPYFPPPALLDPGWYADSAIPLLITEGIKKVLAVAQTAGQAFPIAPISVHGVDMLHDVAHRRVTSQRRPHSDLRAFLHPGRVVYLAFDGGDTSEKPSVILAEAQGSRVLLEAGVDVRLVRVPFTPGGSKVGIDDYLVAQPDRVAALHALLERALLADPLARARVAAALQGPERAGAVEDLLEDLSFAAGLKIGSNATLDLVAQVLRNAGIRWATIQGVVEGFNEQLARQRERGANANRDEVTEGFTPEIEAEADQLLQDPNLLDRFHRGLAAEGVVGELDATVVLLLAMVTRKTKRPVHVAVKAASSSGKNWLTNKVAARLPPGDVLFPTDLSPRSLLYLKDPIKGKVFVIAEQEGAQRAEYAMRIAMSEGSLSILVAEKVENGEGSTIETREHKVEGPACFITTTTRATLNDENETRLLEVTLDESQGQTQRIIRDQAERAANPPSEDELAHQGHERRVWQCALSKLEITETVNPGAPQLAEGFPTKNIRSRRDFQRVLDLASASALLHQRQRRAVAGRVLVEDRDLHAAREWCDALYTPIPPRLMEVAERLRAGFGTTQFSPRAAASHLGVANDPARRLLSALEDLELVEKVQESKGSRPAIWKMASPSSPGSPGPSTTPTPSGTPQLASPYAPGQAAGAAVRQVEAARPTDPDPGPGRGQVLNSAGLNTLPGRPATNGVALVQNPLLPGRAAISSAGLTGASRTVGQGDLPSDSADVGPIQRRIGQRRADGQGIAGGSPGPTGAPQRAPGPVAPPDMNIHAPVESDNNAAVDNNTAPLEPLNFDDSELDGEIP